MMGDRHKFIQVFIFHFQSLQSTTFYPEIFIKKSAFMQKDHLDVSVNACLFVYFKRYGFSAGLKNFHNNPIYTKSTVSVQIYKQVSKVYPA
jgi:hypothetical protein